ncbi:HER212Cp [Eremothecium sinecaudum]|uniref:HER212Cp n=1 Tax=Eremothecium sinecaudum TaxID=45286 RepID=A0A0X8HU24_9SACH|nr:HER212Cp [Eremothecium sinecaudum]AMD21490.1 HER212Cp [Eremothecium sinecaudum]
MESYAMDASEKSRLAQRKARFSKAANESILANPLADRGLLSRMGPTSNNSSINKLLDSFSAKESLLVELETLYTKSPNAEVLGHGLCKLRQIIVSNGAKEFATDQALSDLSYRLFKLSVEYHSSQEQWLQVGFCLKYISDNLAHLESASDYQACLVVYTASMESDAALALDRLQQYLSPKSNLYHICLQLIKGTASPNIQWFKAVYEMPEDCILRKFIISQTPIFRTYQAETLRILSRSYRQFPLAAIERQWFYGLSWNSTAKKELEKWPVANGIVKFFQTTGTR